MTTNDCAGETRAEKPKRRRKRRVPRNLECHVCSGSTPFSWQCRNCGFTLCQVCMNENMWGLSCNGITWGCPECGEKNDLGNQ